MRQDAVHILAEQEAEFREPGLGKPFKGVPTDLLLPARSHLLKVPQPLRIALPAGEQGFKTRGPGERFRFKPCQARSGLEPTVFSFVCLFVLYLTARHVF